MRLAFITDLHIDRPGSILKGVDVCRNFQRTLESVKRHKADRIVIGGDLCYTEAYRESYCWIKGLLDEQDIPYHILPGNHDDVTLLSEVFAVTAFNTLLDLEENRGLLFHTDGFTEKDRYELQTLLENNRVTVLFTHYPPVLCDVPHMDSTYALKNHEEFFGRIRDLGVKFVFCGHYHMEKTCFVEGLSICITPSTFFQIHDTYDTVSAVSQKIGWRVIDFRDTIINTRVEWL